MVGVDIDIGDLFEIGEALRHQKLGEELVHVERAASISVRYVDAEGTTQELADLSRAESELLQHEVDHLHGRFFFDHLNPIKRQLVKARIRRTYAETAKPRVR